MKPRTLSSALVVLGLLSLLPYLSALHLGNLGEQIVSFEIVFFAAFALYGLAVIFVLRNHRPTPIRLLALIFGFAIVFRAILVFTPPALSDDMYRYVWDGRVQANRINPYAYPPDAPELQPLRDDAVWPLINRRSAMTVYPAGAQVAYAALWRIWPDNVRWFQIAMTAGDVLAGVLLVLLLRALGRPAHLALIYLWSPLVVFETAHSAHVDGLVLPFLVGAWLAREKRRDGLTGLLLGAATSLKLYPAMLLPALWRPHGNGRRLHAGLMMPLTFAAVFALAYVPYFSQGSNVIGYLPQYLGERFNWSLAGIVTGVVEQAGGQPERVVNGVLLAALAVIGLMSVLRLPTSDEQAIRRCVWPIGAFTLLTQNLYPWYMLWLVPLLALFVRPGKLGLRLDAWAGWLLFSGLVALAYTAFIARKPVAWATYVEFVPLYALLIVPTVWSNLRETREARVSPSSS